MKGKGKEGNILTGVSGSGEGLNGDTGFLNTNNGPEPWVNFENRGDQSSHVSEDQPLSGSSIESNDTTKQQLDSIQKGIQDLGKRLAILENKVQQRELHPNETKKETTSKLPRLACLCMH